MALELSAEEVVTNLLAKNGILKPVKNVFITSPADLGNYLKNLPTKKEESFIKDSSKYLFIKS